MTLPGETKAGPAEIQSCRGLALGAHRDDDRDGRVCLSRSPQRPIESRDPHVVKVAARNPGYSLTESAASPFHAEPTQVQLNVDHASPNGIPGNSRDEYCDTGWKAKCHQQRKVGGRGDGRRLIVTSPSVIRGNDGLPALSLITQPRGRRVPVRSGRAGMPINHAVIFSLLLPLHFLSRNEDS